MDLSKLSPQKLTERIQEADQSSSWQNQTRSIVETITERHKLEAIGRGLSYKQSLDLIAFLSHPERENLIKLKPLLLGLPHKTFKEILLNASKEEWKPLFQSTLKEVNEHQIRLYIHEIENKLDQFVERYASIEKTSDPLEEIFSQIESLQEASKELLHEMPPLLSFAWQLDSPQIIEELTKIKEAQERFLYHQIGQDAPLYHQRTGIYERLNEKLFTIYGKLNDHQIETLHDDDPIMEGLLKLHVSYLQDLWEVGLLPEGAPLELDPSKYSDEELIDHRNQLFETAQDNLKKLHLKTVCDLKNHWVYSKESLANFVKRSLLSVDNLH